MQTFSAYNANNSDAIEYQVKIILFTFGIYACFGAYVLDWLGLWWMVAIVSVLVTRWMIAFHELFHLKKAEDLDYITRLVPIPFAPINLGYREYRAIHIGHHQHTATPQDPDAFHILGGSLKAFIGAVTQHEQATFRYISAHGVSGELAVMMIIRFSLFVSMFALSPSAFLIWWLVLRITYIINDFVFFHIVHYRSGVSGTFPLPLPSFIKFPALLVYGIDVVYATMHHETHHHYSKIAAKHLPLVTKKIQPSK
ncbi:MAG: fatty acid desaturase [Cocleimonas sp.]|nr:fatty acid desaturase [Cocleimonas sp.]